MSKIRKPCFLPGSNFHTKVNHPNIYYKKRLVFDTPTDKPSTEFSVIHSKVKPPTAKYIGFGEKGGYNLCRNSKQLSYFNFDNMRYSVVYGKGPLDPREPLYHSDPFFLEFYGVPGEKSVYGIFSDNSSETFIDAGYINSQEYLLGTTYGDLDYYFFLGETSEHIINEFTAITGKTRLMPRFVLGYHQGCYGYENKYDLVDVANGYRGNDIPLDGLHVDVDIQKNYCTFTMDENKFPKDTFEKLRQDFGIKCSTNITPVISYLNDSYNTFKSGYDNACFVKDNRSEYTDQDTTTEKTQGYYAGGVYYGGDRGTFGHYSDFGNKDVRLWWGQQYKTLINRGLAMIWQDMTTPAIPESGQYKLDGHDGYIESDMRSFPFNLLLTDNSFKKFKGEAEKESGASGTKLSPAGKIRNVYSYNLHKATYHGLSNIWYIHKFTFTTIINTDIDKAFFVTDSENIVSSLLSKNIIKSDGVKKGKFYVVDKHVNLDDPNLDLGIDPKYDKYRKDIISILKESRDLEAKRKNKRNFIIGRGGFTGMHRFAGLWTGDNASTWDFLKINVSQVLSLGLTGQAITGSDVGGFESPSDWEKWADPQLLIRWTSLGAFLPWFRNHYIKKQSKYFQEPYKYQDYTGCTDEKCRDMYKSVLPVCKTYIKLRYKLMQLFYDAMFENTITGMPIVRPLFLHEDHDCQLFNDKLSFLNNQFFVGKDLLVAPIMDEQNQENGNGSRDIYFPGGSYWYQFRHNRSPLLAPEIGGSTINFFAGLDHNTTDENNEHVYYVLPLYVREGAIIPMVEEEKYVGEYLENNGRPSPITINIYPTKQVKSFGYSMYIDDGESRDSAPAGNPELGFDPEAKGNYRQVDISHNYTDQTPKTRTITIDRSKHDQFNVTDIYKYKFGNYYFLAILHDPGEMFVGQKGALTGITVNGKTVEFDTNANPGNEGSINNFNNSPDNKWYFNDNLNLSYLKVFDSAEVLNIALSYH